MRKSTALACVLALSGLAAAPAFADCAADVKAASEAAAKATDATKKADAEKHIAEAKSHLAMGHEDVCEQHVAAANAALK
jgi:hypothetical protein